MDIYDYLKKDHETVAQLFKQFEKADNHKARFEIVTMLSKELTLHAIAEEKTFYKVLEKHKQSREEALHGEKEHQEILDNLEMITSSSSINDAWIKKVLHLKEIVEHHVDEEEGDMFTMAKKVLSEDDAKVIKEQMHDYKDSLLASLEV